MDDASLKRMNNLPRFVQHKTALRLIALALLIVSMMGPWMYDLINVPAEYDCDKPFIRLEGDFCGYPLSGYFVMIWFVGGGFFSSLVRLILGTFTGEAREFIAGYFLLILIPFITTLSFIWKKETRQLRTVNLVAWTIALIPLLFICIISITQYGGTSLRLWGLWLYIVTALGAMIFETILLKRKPDNK